MFRSTDEIESAMSYFPSFMSSYASMIQQLSRPNIDVSVLAQLRGNSIHTQLTSNFSLV